ncbi:MAG TPA: hypothetical protein VKB78_13235 [Pirellulales bacterium]|nr:hypothetical protein [Pirellulales bacterium]
MKVGIERHDDALAIARCTENRVVGRTRHSQIADVLRGNARRSEMSDCRTR